MYDGDSLAEFLREAGFADVAIMPSGKTNIADPGDLNLAERASESVYVEAVRPLSGQSVYLAGNVMVDTLLANAAGPPPAGRWPGSACGPGTYGLVTLHRPADVDHPAVLGALLPALAG